jgi:Fuc2NAc and GlcNAc transferase
MLALLFAAASALLVGAYRLLALRRQWLDIPNARSSHRAAVPRGAGIVIVLLTMAAAAVDSASSAFFTVLLPGLGIAAIGWWDDLGGLSARIRFLAYGSCALVALLLLTGIPSLADLPGWAWLAAGVVALLWLINLYNFMDGINGLAALEAIFIVAGASALSAYSPNTPGLEPFAISVAAILCGFLAWNFPRARVFMGDVGSAFLGFLLGLWALWSHLHGGPVLAVWAVLGACFIADASYTLAVRMGTGQRWYEAHRSHAYQKLTSRWQGSHVKTVAAFMGVNLAWLLPLAWAIQSGQLAVPTALLLAYLPLIAGCYALKAGIPAATEV